MGKYLYMLVTADEYELPLAVGDSLYDLARILGVSPSAISHSLHRDSPHNRTRYVRVEINENEEDES